MATITQQAPVLPAPPGRAGFGGTLRSEFTKIGSVRSTYWTLLMLFAVSVGIGAAISAVVAGGWSQPPPPPPAPPDIYEATQVSLAGMLVLGQLVIVVLGALVLSAEYSEAIAIGHGNLLVITALAWGTTNCAEGTPSGYTMDP